MSTDQPDANVEEKGCAGGLCVWPYAVSSYDSSTFYRVIIERKEEDRDREEWECTHCTEAQTQATIQSSEDRLQCTTY